MSNIVSGRKSKPSYEVLSAIISTNDDINSRWLLTGKGKALEKQEIKDSVLEKTEVKYVLTCMEMYMNAKYTIEVQKKVIENLELLLSSKTKEED